MSQSERLHFPVHPFSVLLIPFVLRNRVPSPFQPVLNHRNAFHFGMPIVSPTGIDTKTPSHHRREMDRLLERPDLRNAPQFDLNSGHAAHCISIFLRRRDVSTMPHSGFKTTDIP